MAEFTSNRKSSKRTLEATKASLAAGGITLQAELKKSLSTPGGGPRSGGASFPRSVPGAAPTVQTGLLRRSVQSVDASQGDTLRNRVGTNVRYGRYLEFGTRKMAARPWVRPTVAKAKGKVFKAIASSFSRRMAS